VGRLSAHNYRKTTKKLKALGFEFRRHAAGSHEIWAHKTTGGLTTIPNHPGDLPEGTLRAILKQAKVEIETFLEA
jgi:predicted RNA binding protein YcfA (HicA-like mRNA interferase family)